MRKTYIDNIRWITVILVVIYHVIYMFNGVTTSGIIGPFSENQPQDIYLYIVYPWFMLLLFVISGMSARYELEKKGDKDFLKDRTRKYLVPSTLGLLVLGWAMGYYNMLIGGAFESMGELPAPILYLIMSISGCGVLWYVQVLWVFSLLTKWIRKFEKGKIYELCGRANTIVLILLTLLIFGAAQILNVPVVIVYRFGIYGAGYFIGYFVLAHDEVMERLGKQWIWLIVMGIASCVAFVIVFLGKNFSAHEVLDTPLCNVFAWMGTLAVLAFMKKWGDFTNRFTEWNRKKSWGIYVFHYFFIAVTGWYLRKLAPNLAPVIVYLLVTVSAFAGSLISYELISRIPFVRWCVLGIKGEKKK